MKLFRTMMLSLCFLSAPALAVITGPIVNKVCTGYDLKQTLDLMNSTGTKYSVEHILRGEELDLWKEQLSLTSGGEGLLENSTSINFIVPENEKLGVVPIGTDESLCVVWVSNLSFSEYEQLSRNVADGLSHGDPNK